MELLETQEKKKREKKQKICLFTMSEEILYIIHSPERGIRIRDGSKFEQEIEPLKEHSHSVIDHYDYYKNTENSDWNKHYYYYYY